MTRNDPAEGRSCRDVEPFEGMTMEIPSSSTVSTKLERIAGLAKQMQGKCLCALGDFATSPVTGTIRKFREEYVDHIRSGHSFNSRWSPE